MLNKCSLYKNDYLEPPNLDSYFEKSPQLYIFKLGNNCTISSFKLHWNVYEVYVATCHLLLSQNFQLTSCHSQSFWVRGTHFQLHPESTLLQAVPEDRYLKQLRVDCEGSERHMLPWLPCGPKKKGNWERNLHQSKLGKRQTFFTGLKGKVISMDSDLRGILWRAPVCSAGFSHLPLEIEW